MSGVLYSADIIAEKLKNLTPKQKKTLLIGGGVAAATVAAVVLIPQVSGAPGLASVSMKVDTTNGFVPFSPTIQGIALDKNDAPLAGAILSLFVNGKTVATTKTVKDGSYVFQPIFNQEGDYVVSVGAGSVRSSETTLHVQPHSADQVVASITIAGSKSSGAPGDTITFSGQALDSTGAGVPSTSLYLFVSGSKQASMVSDSKGNYSFQATFPNSGAYSVDVSDQTTNQ